MTRDFPAGNYQIIPAVFQYSSGAAANPVDHGDMVLGSGEEERAFAAVEYRNPAAAFAAVDDIGGIVPIKMILHQDGMDFFKRFAWDN